MQLGQHIEQQFDRIQTLCDADLLDVFDHPVLRGGTDRTIDDRTVNVQRIIPLQQPFDLAQRAFAQRKSDLFLHGDKRAKVLRIDHQMKERDQIMDGIITEKAVEVRNGKRDPLLIQQIRQRQQRKMFPAQKGHSRVVFSEHQCIAVRCIQILRRDETDDRIILQLKIMITVHEFPDHFIDVGVTAIIL